jgi:hypothetical protein
MANMQHGPKMYALPAMKQKRMIFLAVCGDRQQLASPFDDFDGNIQPIIQKLMALGMGRGPALTLFLTGNALSLPSMIVLFKVMGKKQAPAYILIIMVLSVIAGWLFGEVI